MPYIHINYKADPATGLAWLWHNKKEEWVRRHPADVDDLVECGECSLTKPEDVGDAAEIQPPGFTEAGPPTKAELKERLVTLSKNKLQEMCTKNSVEWSSMDTKPSLVAKLVSAGVFVPNEQLGSAAGED